jgi:hypothetical protein
VVDADPSKTATPQNPAINPNQTIGCGRGDIPESQPSKTIWIGTVATIRLASPLGMNFSEMVTPPLPTRIKHAPTASALFQLTQAVPRAPWTQAMAYRMAPARK